MAKLIQWKNKKFRELMTAKTFIELNSSRQKLEEEHFSDPMKALSAMFQREFEQLINEQYFFPLNRRKPEELVQLHSVQQKLREEEQQERDAFALESKGSVPQQLIEGSPFLKQRLNERSKSRTLSTALSKADCSRSSLRAKAQWKTHRTESSPTSLP